MSTAAVSQASLSSQIQTFFQHRTSDLRQLRQALESGDLAGAKQAFAALTELGNKAKFAQNDPFFNAQRAQDFQAIGQALQSGDLHGAQQALKTLIHDFHQPPVHGPLPAVGPNDTPVSAPGSGVNVVA